MAADSVVLKFTSHLCVWIYYMGHWTPYSTFKALFYL